MTGAKRSSVGVIIIGDELLKGSIKEANIAFFVERFRALGAELSEVVIVGDQRALLAKKIRAFAGRFDHVCTTGGIGPTHDDVTLDAVGDAFGVPLVQHVGLQERIKAFVGSDLNEGHLRLSRLPLGSQLIESEALQWPVLSFENVVIFPGVPHLLRRKFRAIESMFRGTGFHWAALTISRRETEICTDLDAIALASPEVNIGSYPRLEGDTWVVQLTVDGPDADAVAAVHLQLCGLFETCLLGSEGPSLSTHSADE